MELDIEKIKFLMIEKNLSYVKIAKETKMSPSNVNRLMRGRWKCRFTTIKKLADALKVEPKEIVKTNFKNEKEDEK